MSYGKVAAILALVVALAAGAWPGSSHLLSTPIAEIRENPRAFDHRTVVISDEVVDRFSLFGWKTLLLQDDTGEIRVLSRRILPEVGVRVRVRGKVEESFTLGSLQCLVLIEEPG